MMTLTRSFKVKKVPLFSTIWFQVNKKKMTHTDYKLNPEQFKILRVMGEGTFGEVRKCLKKDTKEIVAAKIPKNIASAKNEVRQC